MKKVNNKSLALFFDNLSFLVGAGVDPLTAVTTLSDGADKSTSSITKILSKELREGKDLSQAFEKHKLFFRSASYSVYIAAGLRSGELQSVLARLAKSLTETAGVQKQISGAMLYPAFLLLVTIVASYYMFTTIVPQIGSNLQEMSGKELPAITKAAMSISDFLINKKLVLFVGVLAAAIAFKFLFSAFRSPLSRLATKLPVVGLLIVKIDMSNFYSNLSNMINSHIAISECLTVCAGGAKNRYIKNQLTVQAARHNERGTSLKEFFSSLPFASPSERQCIVVAEDTGKLPEMFSKIAERNQKELQQAIKSALTLIEPSMLLIMGSIIGLIVFAVYLPIISMSSM